MPTKLQIDQLDRKIKPFARLKKNDISAEGWIKVLRTSLGITLFQLAEKMNISRQNLHEMERREPTGNITLKKLDEAAKAMDMQLVYAFVPNDGSLDELIERKAKELATNIVMRTSNTMKLEEQKNSEKRLRKAIDERAAELKRDLPSILWD
jgi:predicted DNA-binding mobile mystery protein A